MTPPLTVQRGFTMIELMVTVAIAVILLTIAVPSFKESQLNSQLRASANNLIASANLARGEAIKRSAPVNLCVSSDGATCGTGGWEQGWIVLSGAEVLYREEPTANGFLISTGGTNSFSFQPTGVDATAGSFVVCRTMPVGSQERVVTIDVSGRAWLRRTTTGICS
jgi:type IV fimbrial biogenesis protein FimT